MVPHTNTPAVRAVCRCKAKAGLRSSPWGTTHDHTIVITTQIESTFVAENDLVPFCCSPVPSCVTPLQTETLAVGCH
ncbi:hypothetical protein TNCV_1188461 [Trichonephila clavipes]|nr:hypothetical protein TNCV_1188461 [Trichonephila clavipes]